MKKLLLLLAVLLLPLALADNIYLAEDLTVKLDVKGEFELIPQSSGASLNEVTVNLMYSPTEDYRQEVLQIDTEGTISTDKVKFYWNDGELGKKDYSYSALIKTKNGRMKVKQKIPFPLENLENGYKEYLLPTETIDSETPAIVAQATSLAEGEDDLFKVVFNLANWVERNVGYNLNTLTATASQKASWVLENREGVCDEMTSLFIAMCRSLGIPARFVSGVSYTTSELFVENWQPHGWAEVYFPNVGWVGFDITFGEYGYVDVTHLQLRNGFDPAEAATKFEWLAKKVSLEAGELNTKVQLVSQGKTEMEEVLLEQEILSERIGFGSYNLVKGILKNTADHYVASTLKLAAPPELKIVGKNKRTVLLSPKEVRETYWIVQVPGNLNHGYLYTFPLLIYSEKNVSVQEIFKVGAGEKVYSQKEIEELTVEDEEKTYSRKVSFICDYPKAVDVGKEVKINCTIKNSGNTNLEDVDFCLGDVCELVNLPINQKESTAITILKEEPGWNKIFITAKNDQIEKRASLEFAVLDDPNIKVNLVYSQELRYNEPLEVGLELEKNSFNDPQEMVVVISGPGWESEWTLEKLKEKEILTLKPDQKRFGKNNKLDVTTMWKDQKGKLYSERNKIEFVVVGEDIGEKFRLLLNSFLNWFI